MAKKVKNQQNTWIIAVLTAIILISGAVTIGAMNLFCTDYLYIDYSTGFTTQSILCGASVLALTAAIIAAVYRLTQSKKAVTVLLVTAAVLRLISALFWTIEPESDFKITYELAKLLCDTSPWHWGQALDDYGTVYNSIWSAHMPFIVYQSLILRIFNHTITLRLANAVISWGTCVITAKTARHIGGDKAYHLALCAMALNPTVIFFVPILTNQHVSQFFFVLAIWIFMCHPQHNIYIRAWLSGLCIGISHLLRPEMQPVAIAITAFVIYSVFTNGEAVKKLTVYTAGLCTFLAVIAAANSFLTSAEVVHNDIYSGNLNYKIMVGLNPETGGSWSENDSELIGTNEKINQVIRGRLKNPHLIPMMYGKAAYQLGTYVYTWSYRNDAQWVSQIVMRRGGAALMLLVCIMAVWNILRRRRYDLAWMYLTLLCYAMTYSIIEVQGRYSFTFIPLLILIAAI